MLQAIISHSPEKYILAISISVLILPIGFLIIIRENFLP